MGNLRNQKNEWFFDTSNSSGYGVVCGELYLKISHSEVISILAVKYTPEVDVLFIAYQALLEALFSFQAFAKNRAYKIR